MIAICPYCKKPVNVKAVIQIRRLVVGDYESKRVIIKKLELKHVKKERANAKQEPEELELKRVK